ncbi:MAG: FecR domain-containing protein [Candidatus Kryptonium sp.]
MIRVLRGEVKGEELRKFENWLKRSTKNQKEFEQVKKIWNSAGNLRKIEFEPMREWLAIKNKITRQEAIQKAFLIGLFEYFVRLLRRGRFYVLAVILMLISGVVVHIFSKFGHEASKDVQHIVVVETGKGEVKEIILPDNSVVFLNSNSRIFYPSKFSFADRSVKLEGEAYFMVHLNETTPFQVKAGENTILVTGTSFNVRYRDRCCFLYVDTGSVVFINERSGQALKVYEGNLATAFDDEGIKDISKSDRNIHLMWMFGKVVFRGQFLIDVLKELQNYYDFDFVFIRTDLMGKKISGEFNRDLGIEKILEAISFSVGAEVELVKKGPKVLVKIK